MDFLQYVVLVVLLLGLTASAFVWTRATLAVVVAFAALVAAGVLDEPTQLSPFGVAAFRAHPDTARRAAALTCHYRAFQALGSRDPNAVSAALRACQRAQGG